VRDRYIFYDVPTETGWFATSPFLGDVQIVPSINVGEIYVGDGMTDIPCFSNCLPMTRKINLEKVRASLDAVCPTCRKVISPAQVRRIDFERIECPVCGERFVPSPKR
jgi:hypothetical protein